MDSGQGGEIGPLFYLLLLWIDFVLSGYGEALLEVSESLLEERGKSGDTRAEEIHRLKDHPEHFIHASWFYLILSAMSAVYAVPAGTLPRRIAWSAGFLAVLYLLGKSVPRLIGKRYPESFCRKLYRMTQVLIWISLPFTWVLNQVTWFLVRLIGIRPKDLADEVTEDEIISMVNEGHEQGVLDEHEAEMIQNIFELDDKEAHDIMTHRKHIVAIEANTLLSEAITFMVGESNSRFPVYESNIDNILGVLHFKDAMIFHDRKKYDSCKIKEIPDLIRPVNFIPETRSIDQLFRTMQAQKLQMVIVVDEYGETAGLVTMEDILEEIVGNILDEYDEEEKQILQQKDGSWVMAGMTPLPEVEETLGIQFDTDDYDTLNGYLVSRLDRIPEKKDEKLVIPEQGFAFEIRKVEGRTIRWVRVSRQR